MIVGVMMAKGLAMAKNIPFIPINRLEAHELTARLTNRGYLLLTLLSSRFWRNCQFLIVEMWAVHTYLGGTLDDAIGECLDKTGRLLGYAYPAGPTIPQRLALTGTQRSIPFRSRLKVKKTVLFLFQD